MSTVDFKVSQTAYSNYSPSAIRLADDRLVVAWQSIASDANLLFRIYDPDGGSLGDERALHSYSEKVERSPALAALADGGFVAVWERLDSGSGKSNILGQRYDRDGNPVGFEFVVDKVAPDSQFLPSVTGLADGGFVVGWVAPDTSLNGIFTRRYDAFGAKVGDVIQVNAARIDEQTDVAMAGLPDGGWVVAFADLDSGAIRYKMFDSSGAVSLAGTRADNLEQPGLKLGTSVAVLSDGDFVIAWYNINTGGIYARQFSATGVGQYTEFRVNPLPSAGQGHPDIDALEDGGFVITWKDETNDTVLFQRYDPEGKVVGPAGTALASSDVGQSEPPAVVGLAGGGWVTFASAGEDSGNDQIYAAVRAQGSAQNDIDTLTVPGSFDALAGDDLVNGSTGADLIFGRDGADLLNGNAGDDTLLGGLGNDRIRGGEGADIILCGEGDDFVWGDSENDIIKGGGGNDTLDGGKDKDRMNGGDGDDVLIGGGREDILFGGRGDDDIRGDNGIDRIDGGAGNDLMRGGQGADVFLFRARNFGEDVIVDFQDGLDRLHVKGLVNSLSGITIEKNGTDAILTFGGGELVLRGMSQLVDASDFVF